MRVWPKTSKRRKTFFALIIASVPLAIWISSLDVFHKPPPNPALAVLVLEDSDSDFKRPPFEDRVLRFDSAKRTLNLKNLNLCQTVGGHRALSASDDGRFFLVSENVGHRLTASRQDTGTLLWRIDGQFEATSISQHGVIYALLSSGTIYGDKAMIIDGAGVIQKQSGIGGFDLVIDDAHQALWVVGSNIKKCDLDLNILFELTPIRWCAVSIDVNPDGSVWVAEREHPNSPQSRDRILKISSAGEIVKTVDLDFSPLCVRVDRSDGGVWVTGIEVRKLKTGELLQSIEQWTGRWPIGQAARGFLTSSVAGRTEKRDSDGELRCKLSKGGHTLAIDQSNGSAWLGGANKIYQFSREGKKLGQLGGVSTGQKYIVVVPEAEGRAGHGLTRPTLISH